MISPTLVTHSPFLGRLAVIVAALGVAHALATHTAIAVEPERIRRDVDADTGRNLLNYPPHLSADIQHIALRLTIPDMNVRQMYCEATIRFKPLGTQLATLRLHAAGLNVSSVTVDGSAAAFEKQVADEVMTIRLPAPVPMGSTGEVLVRYSVSDPAEGLYWTVANPARPDEAPQLHSQGESELNRYWFPCHDFPNDRCSTEITVTVPAGYQAISNGKLVSRSRHRESGTETFYWSQSRPHPAYLVSLVVGKFEVVDVGTSRLAMPVYVPPGRTADARRVFDRTPAMVDLLANVTGEPFPWDKYAQVVVRNFGWGGMENTSATTLYEGACQSADADLDGNQDGLIAHELAHQWFGNLLTCRSWEHIWLNEGFATYSEALWEQYKGDRFNSRAPTAGDRADAYDALIWEWSREVIENDKPDAPFQAAMASKQYRHPDDVFEREANPYPKGALVLHMLRMTLGDEIFFKGLRTYVGTYKDQSVETYQFRTVLEQVSGRSLQRFFDQWVFRPGVPTLKVSKVWDRNAEQLTITIEQLQSINGDNPAFFVRVPVWVRAANAKNYDILEVVASERTKSVSFPCATEPAEVLIDPRGECLANYELNVPMEELLRQMASGPTLIARLRAAAELGRIPDLARPESIKRLTGVAMNTGAQSALRIEAARSLGAIAGRNSAVGPAAITAAHNLSALLAQTRGETGPRVEIIRQIATSAMQLPEAERAEVVARLRSLAATDRSINIRAESLRTLGKLKPDGVLDDLRRGMETTSDFDRISVAAVDALASVGGPEALTLAIDRTTAAHRSNVRAAAARSVGSLWSHDPGRAIATLSALLASDADVRTREAAGSALATISDPAARAALERFAAVAKGRSWTADAARWLEENAHAARSQ